MAHLVDLTALQCLGRCTCETFSIRSLPAARGAIDRGEDPDPKLRCKHIKEAREYILDRILGKLATGDLNTPDPI